MLSKAVGFAKEKHKKQFRRFENEPYVNHPIRVAKILRQNKGSHRIEELLEAALLHDTLEDTNTTELELKENFGNLVLSIVKELTSNEEEIKRIGKAKYLSRKLLGLTDWASPEFKERYARETRIILKNLGRRKLTKNQKVLVKKIREKINQ